MGTNTLGSRERTRQPRVPGPWAHPPSTSFLSFQLKPNSRPAGTLFSESKPGRRWGCPTADTSKSGSLTTTRFRPDGSPGHQKAPSSDPILGEAGNPARVFNNEEAAPALSLPPLRTQGD